MLLSNFGKVSCHLLHVVGNLITNHDTKCSYKNNVFHSGTHHDSLIGLWGVLKAYLLWSLSGLNYFKSFSVKPFYKNELKHGHGKNILQWIQLVRSRDVDAPDRSFLRSIIYVLIIKVISLIKLVLVWQNCGSYNQDALFWMIRTKEMFEKDSSPGYSDSWILCT